MYYGNIIILLGRSDKISSTLYGANTSLTLNFPFCSPIRPTLEDELLDHPNRASGGGISQLYLQPLADHIPLYYKQDGL